MRISELIEEVLVKGEHELCVYIMWFVVETSGQTLVDRHCIRIMVINPVTALIRELTMFVLC